MQKLTVNLENFRKELWQCYLKENEELFNELKTKFSALESEISILDVTNTKWKETNCENLDRKNLEAKNFLSQGERRALYLLNIIFEIEARKNKEIR